MSPEGTIADYPCVTRGKYLQRGKNSCISDEMYKVWGRVYKTCGYDQKKNGGKEVEYVVASEKEDIVLLKF